MTSVQAAWENGCCRPTVERFMSLAACNTESPLIIAFSFGNIHCARDRSNKTKYIIFFGLLVTFRISSHRAKLHVHIVWRAFILICNRGFIVTIYITYYYVFILVQILMVWRCVSPRRLGYKIFLYTPPDNLAVGVDKATQAVDVFLYVILPIFHVLIST